MVINVTPPLEEKIEVVKPPTTVGGVQPPRMEGVVVHKFYQEVSVYPDGQTFIKVTPLGKFERQQKKKKERKKMNFEKDEEVLL